MKKKSNIILHALIAVVLSLVVNFSYLLTPIITEQGAKPREELSLDAEHTSGVLYLDRDLHGYIVCDCDKRDSTYVTAWQVQRHRLQEGDRLIFSTRTVDERNAEFSEGAHPRLDRVYMRNGEELDIDTVYDRPSRTMEFIWQIVYYALVSLAIILILVWIPKSGNYTNWAFMRRLFIAVLLSLALTYIAPIVSFKDGAMRIVSFFQADAHTSTYYIVLTKYLFMLVVSILYARIYLLLRQRQVMEVENERLKNENLSTRYNMLMGQINPHFFFNSLNSLAMLVREGDQSRALEYIDQLSYTFRYIIQNGQTSNTTLKDEMAFVDAYAYLFKIRYADKLFFDISIPEEYLAWILPALSLQPLIGNAVKHNSITTKNPLHIYIRVEDDVLVVENKKQPKLDVEPSTGIGLSNLNSRWQIIVGQEIEIIDTADSFQVRLPLTKPKSL